MEVIHTFVYMYVDSSQTIHVHDTEWMNMKASIYVR